MASYAEFDRSEFPLIVVKFTGAKETDANFAAYLEGLLENYNAKKAFALVFDATDAARPNLKYQQRQAKWMKEHEELIKSYCLGVAYVMPHTFLRMVLKMIFSIQKNAVPFKVFGNLEQGRRWATARTAHSSEEEQWSS